MVRITAASLSTLDVAKVFRDNAARINHLDISTMGDLCVTSSEDDTIHVYDCTAGKLKRTLFSKKYGVSHIHFAHGAKSVIHASTKVDDTIRYLSLHDNKYIRYFVGHKKRVISIATSPLDDLFLSTSLDNTLRVWDVRSHHCQGVLHAPGPINAAFDPQGLIFGAAGHGGAVHLYDLRSFDKGPFSTFHAPNVPDAHDIKFSPDGKLLLMAHRSTGVTLLDAFTGEWRCTIPLSWPGPLASPAGEAIGPHPCFSPDGQFIFCGTPEGHIRCFQAWTGKDIALLRYPQSAAQPTLEGGEHVVFNPKMMMMISQAGSELAFWIPTSEEE